MWPPQKMLHDSVYENSNMYTVAMSKLHINTRLCWYNHLYVRTRLHEFSHLSASISLPPSISCRFFSISVLAPICSEQKVFIHSNWATISKYNNGKALSPHNNAFARRKFLAEMKISCSWIWKICFTAPNMSLISMVFDDQIAKVVYESWWEWRAHAVFHTAMALVLDSVAVSFKFWFNNRN